MLIAPLRFSKTNNSPSSIGQVSSQASALVLSTMSTVRGVSDVSGLNRHLTRPSNYAILRYVKKRQLAFNFPKRGGKRRGAGRPRIHERPGVVGPGVPHLTREAFASRRAVHVTQRLRPDAGYLRKQGPAAVLLKCFRAAAELGGIRIAHYSIQGNHLHLVVEAEDAQRLSRGIQGLSVRIARRLNARIGRKGAVFADRYHAHVLGTRREVANAIRYVTGNYQHHAREYLPAGYCDPLATQPLHPLVRPKLWLLSVGWQAEPPGRGLAFEPP
jgi:putative transposase